MTEHGVVNEPVVRRARFAELDAGTLYDLLRLRGDVFVVEQKCAYPDLDGRDTEPATEHLWTADGCGASSYLRVLTDADGSARIGRVCTRADARGMGLAAVLLSDVLNRVVDRAVVLEAQQYLTGWYRRFGFEPTGPSYLDDGIPHVPMRLRPAR